MPVATRLDSSAQIETLIEELKNSEGYCIVPNKVLEVLVTENANLHTKTSELNERVTTSIERITQSIETLNRLFETSTTQQASHATELIHRLDSLIEKVSINNTLSTSTTEVSDMEAELKKRKETLEKLTRNEELSKYYEKLLAEPQPFVRREFRTHVNRNTMERELVHRRQQAIDRVKVEINVMQDRVAEYTEKKNVIDQRIADYLVANEDEKTDMEEKMETQSRTIKESFERNTLMKMRKSDDDEKMTTFEYLVKISDNSNSLNYRGRSSRERRRPSRPRGSRQRGY